MLAAEAALLGKRSTATIGAHLNEGGGIWVVKCGLLSVVSKKVMLLNMWSPRQSDPSIPSHQKYRRGGCDTYGGVGGPEAQGQMQTWG